MQKYFIALLLTVSYMCGMEMGAPLYPLGELDTSMQRNVNTSASNNEYDYFNVEANKTAVLSSDELLQLAAQVVKRNLTDISVSDDQKLEFLERFLDCKKIVYDMELKVQAESRMTEVVNKMLVVMEHKQAHTEKALLVLHALYTQNAQSNSDQRYEYNVDINEELRKIVSEEYSTI